MRAGVFLVILAGCGASGGKARHPGPADPFKPGVKVRISDGGQIYDALDTTKCVKWPSEDVRKRAGREGWHDFVPGSGLEGTVVAALSHCDGHTEVVLVAVGDYVVPVTSKGVEVPPADGEGVEGGVVGGVVGGDVYGSAYGGDPYGYGALGAYDPYAGYGGYGYGGYGYGTGYGGSSVALSATSDGAHYVGDVVQIANAGSIYDAINTTDCLAFPSDDLRTRGGATAWGSYYPAQGETGTIVGIATHCSSGEEILILEMTTGGEIVPIAATGVTSP